jgi:hypothetical protein
MLAKMTSRNQITIPKKIVEQLPKTRYFDVSFEDGTVTMKPVTVYDTDLEQIRSKIKKLGLEADTVKKAVQWAREK